MARGTTKTCQLNFQSVSPLTTLARSLKMATSACPAGGSLVSLHQSREKLEAQRCPWHKGVEPVDVRALLICGSKVALWFRVVV